MAKKDQNPTEILPPDLPPIARQMAELIGLSKTLQLVEIFGGSGVYIPEKWKRSDRIHKLVGDESAAALSKHWPAKWLMIPRCEEMLLRERNNQIKQDHADGLTGAMLGLKYELTERQIWRILAGAEYVDPRQGKLF